MDSLKENTRICVMCGSSPCKDPSITLHRFPKPGSKNTLRCELWAKYCFPNEAWSSSKFQDELHSKHKMLCSKHFESTCFNEKKLFRTAVPDVQSYKIMDGLQGRRERSNRDSSRRRLETPNREDRSRSRSGSRMRSPNRSQDEQDFLVGRQRVTLLLEQELRRERERLRATEDRRRSSSRRASERREPSERREAEHRAEPRASKHHEPSGRREAERRAEPCAEQRSNAGENIRSRSPSFSRNDLVNVLKLLKEDLSSQPHNQNAQSSQKLDHQNILPNFDPSTKNQRIDIWLKKVNECASVYGWDDRTTTHFAMQKLQGLAKMWYESLNSILFSWKEWQDKLINAFEQNYGQTLEDMLKRRSKFNEPIEVYYYEKLALVNQCDIVGKRAVDCIIHGLSDRTLRLSALALRCNHPDQLLQFLLSNKDTRQPSADRAHFRNKTVDNTHQNNNQNQAPKSVARSGQPNGCYNCKEKGHSFLHCPKPLLKCQHCNKLGHTTETCSSKPGQKPLNSNATVSKTMRIVSVKKGTIVYYPKLQI